MKRSRSIELALMGTVPLLFAAGCDQQPRALVYHDVQECIDDGQVSADVCQRGYDEALQAQRDAPHFDSLADCEAQFGWGQCQAAPSSSGSWFAPAVAGFLLGRMMGYHSYYRHYSYGSYGAYAGWGGQPLYRARGDRGEWRTLDGTRLGAGVRGPAADNSVAETLSRGGFGRTAAARGSWGGWGG